MYYLTNIIKVVSIMPNIGTKNSPLIPSIRHGVSKTDDSGDWSLPQRKVTMVCWTVDDAFVVTAVSDFTIKVWNASTGQLCHTLKVGRTSLS